MKCGKENRSSGSLTLEPSTLREIAKGMLSQRYFKVVVFGKNSQTFEFLVAEIITRRSLLSFFFREIRMLMKSESSSMMAN